MLFNPDSINLIQLYKPSSRYDTLFFLTKYLVMKYYEIHINLMFYIGVIMLFEVAEELLLAHEEGCFYSKCQARSAERDRLKDVESKTVSGSNTYLCNV